MSGLTKLSPHSKFFAGYYLGHLSENEIHEVDVLSGAFIMADKDVLTKAGSFDESFFMYGEDIDLSYRIQKAGFKNYYFPQGTIIHFKGESTRKETVQYIHSFYGAMLLFVKKHYSGLAAGLYAMLIKTAVALKTAILSIQNIVKNSASSSREKLFANKLFVMGEAATFQKIQQGIQQQFIEQERIDDINLAPEKSFIIFCEPNLSFNKIIVLMQLYKGKYQFLIHTDGTKSIVGSNDKNISGISIEMNR